MNKQHLNYPSLHNRRRFLALGLGLGLGLLVAACDQSDPENPANPQACNDNADNPNTQIRLSPHTLERLDGEMIPMSIYDGKVVVVNIWATWCAPCRREMPALQILSDRLDPDKAVVLGISIDRAPEKNVQAFLEETGVTFPTFLDPKKALIGRKWKVSSLPETFIFAPDGCLMERIVGVRDWDSDQAYNSLRELMVE